MTSQTRQASREMLPLRALLLLAVAVALLLMNFALWRLSTGKLEQNVSLFYWHQLQPYLSGLQCWAFWLAPIAIIFAAKTGSQRLRTWQLGIPTALAGLTLVGCALFHYTAFFVVSLVDHVGTIRLANHTYQLARVIQYDNETTYHIGECDESGFRCRFHEIYRVYLFGENSAAFFVNAQNHLAIRINDEVIYTYDGQIETCTDGRYGRCRANLK